MINLILYRVWFSISKIRQSEKEVVFSHYYTRMRNDKKHKAHCYKWGSVGNELILYLLGSESSKNKIKKKNDSNKCQW